MTVDSNFSSPNTESLCKSVLIHKYWIGFSDTHALLSRLAAIYAHHLAIEGRFPCILSNKLDFFVFLLVLSLFDLFGVPCFIHCPSYNWIDLHFLLISVFVKMLLNPLVEQDCISIHFRHFLLCLLFVFLEPIIVTIDVARNDDHVLADLKLFPADLGYFIFFDYVRDLLTSIEQSINLLIIIRYTFDAPRGTTHLTYLLIGLSIDGVHFLYMFA